MNDPKRLILRCAILVVLAVPNLLIANKTVMFVVDVSSSMTKDALFTRVVDSLTAYLHDNCTEGDRVIVISFGERVTDVADLSVGKGASYAALGRDIRQLRSNEDYTWMAKAFELVGKRLHDVRAAQPSGRVEIYVLTDGQNNPPPGQARPSFQDVLDQYLGDFTAKNVFTYYLSFGVNPDTGTGRFLGAVGAKPTITKTREVPPVPKPPPPVVPETKLPPQPPSGPRPPIWPYLVLAGVIIAGILVTTVLLKNVPRFPRDVYLSVLDETGNELNRYSLKNRQRFANNKLSVSGDLPVRGVVKNCFVLTADRGGALSIRANLKQNPVTITSTAAELSPGRPQVLHPGDEFTVSGARMRLEKGA